MCSEKTAGLIVCAIGQLWGEGIALSREALFFLESGFGISTARELKEAMGEEASQEGEIILEYLLFPDQKLLCILESFLGPAGLTAEEAAGIARRLSRNYSRLDVFYPGQPEPIVIPVPPEQVTVFVSRLNLTGKIDLDICTALEKTAAAGDIPVFRVLLRNRTCRFEGRKKRFLLEFMSKSGGRPQDFGRVFELFLTLLSQAPGAADPAAYFLERVQGEVEMINRIREFERQLSRYSMEYLMLLKYPVPCESFERVSLRLSKLNLIVSDILGIPPPLCCDPPARDLGDFDPEKDLGKLMEILS
ncbi:MAG: hypothetical protein HUN04_21990 [Desulfobacter sp.]|nr:MAG: hypothetical protein HUN04_21990 [Desulfobacter sp.]